MGAAWAGASPPPRFPPFLPRLPLLCLPGTRAPLPCPPCPAPLYRPAVPHTVLLQYYTKDKENVRVANGNLYITALEDGAGGYTSGRINTKQTAGFHPGMQVGGGGLGWAGLGPNTNAGSTAS